MKINESKEVVSQCLQSLKADFIKEPYTESTMDKIQDKIEHMLLTYSKEDIEKERFLSLNIEDSSEKHEDADETICFRLFILDRIYITMSIDLKEKEGFYKVNNLRELKINQEGSPA